VHVLTSVDRETIAELRARDEFFWLDLVSPSEGDVALLGELLRLHPVAQEDSREFGQDPKLDTYDEHVLLVFYTAKPVDVSERCVEPVEVHVHISGAWVLTVRRVGVPPLERLHELLVPADTQEEDYLVYRILDGLADGFYPAIELIEERVDALEGEVLARVRGEQLERIYRLKQEVHDLQRKVSAQSERFPQGSDAILALPGLSRGSKPYLEDVADHLRQVSGELTRQRDDLMALTTTYFNASANRLTARANLLTVAATFFLVWTLVTSFFGQNFGWLVDNISTRTDFLLFGVVGLAVPTLLLAALFWWKRHDWF
jgi:magnesium transporter